MSKDICIQSLNWDYVSQEVVSLRKVWRLEKQHFFQASSHKQSLGLKRTVGRIKIPSPGRGNDCQVKSLIMDLCIEENAFSSKPRVNK